LAPSVARQVSSRTAVMPGGARNVGIGSDLIEFITGGEDADALAVAGGGSCAVPFRRTASGASAQPHVLTNPITGRQEWFRPAGQPVLFSKDFGIVRKVDKLARRAHKAVHRRRSRKR